MRKAFLLLIIILSVLVQLKAQTIINKPKTEITHIPTYSKYSNRYLLNSYSNEKKVIKQSKNLDVVGFMNITKNLFYDSYIINYSGKYYCISKDNVIDNTLLDEKNDSINKEYSILQKKCENFLNEYEKEYASLLKKASDSIDYYTIEINRTSYKIDSIIKLKRNKAADSLDKIKEKWYNKLSPSGKKSSEIFHINNASLSSPNSAGGCDVYFNYTNLHKKTIKYLHWTGFAKNAVNDIVSCDIRDRSSFSGKDTGPVLTGEDGGGVWDCMIYNFSARELVLSNISIEYLDGSRHSIGRNDIKLLIEKPEIDLSKVSLSAGKEFENLLKKYIGESVKWKSIEKTLLINFSPNNVIDSRLYNYMFINLNSIIKNYNNAIKALEEFRNNNLYR